MEERIICGKRAVIEALRAGLPIRRLYLERRDGGGRRDPKLVEALREVRVIISEVPRQHLDRMSGDQRHQGVVAALETFDYLDLDDLLARAEAQGPWPVVVACDEVTDPHNLGAILRSTEALGGSGAVVPRRNVAPITPVVERAAAGATARLPVAQVGNLSDSLERAKKARWWVVGADAEGGQPVHAFDFTRPTVLVVGSEGKGLRTRVRNTCDVLVTIPMSGAIGSLNASVACGVVLYERQRQVLAKLAAGEP